MACCLRPRGLVQIRQMVEESQATAVPRPQTRLLEDCPLLLQLMAAAPDRSRLLRKQPRPWLGRFCVRVRKRKAESRHRRCITIHETSHEGRRPSPHSESLYSRANTRRITHEALLILHRTCCSRERPHEGLQSFVLPRPFPALEGSFFSDAQEDAGVVRARRPCSGRHR